MNLIALALFAALSCSAATWQERLADECIWNAEGGTKTRFPYGVHDPRFSKPTPLPYAEARARCLTIINQEYFKWTNGGCQGDFIEMLSLRYAQNHTVWAKNVKFYMTHPKPKK